MAVFFWDWCGWMATKPSNIFKNEDIIWYHGIYIYIFLTFSNQQYIYQYSLIHMLGDEFIHKPQQQQKWPPGVPGWLESWDETSLNNYIWLVVDLPLRTNIKVSWDDYSQYMKKKTCSKPPTRNISWWSSPRVHLYHVLVGGVNHLEKILVNGKDYPIYSAKIKRMFRTTNQLLYVFNRESASCNVWYLYAVILPNREIHTWRFPEMGATPKSSKLGLGDPPF